MQENSAVFRLDSKQTLMIGWHIGVDGEQPLMMATSKRGLHTLQAA